MSLLSRVVRGVKKALGAPAPKRTRRSPAPAARKAAAKPARRGTYTSLVYKGPKATAAEKGMARINTLVAMGAKRNAAEDRELAWLLRGARTARNPAYCPTCGHQLPTVKTAQTHRWCAKCKTGVRPTAYKPARRNPATPAQIKRAQTASAVFHGERGEAYKLDRTDRKAPPEVVVALGEVVAIEYRPSGRSQRGTSTWRHASLDNGDGHAPGKHRPLLVASPVDGRPYLIMDKSKMRFSRRVGLKG